jgi:type I restriction enzyme S subunit
VTLPKGWVITKASEACDIVQSGGTPKGGFAVNGNVPFLKVYNLVDQKVDFDYRPQFINDEVNNGELGKSRAFPGDILMNIVGPPLGKIAVVPNDYPVWNLNQAITLFRPGAAALTEWIYWFLRGGASVRSIINETRGSAGQVNISLSQCRAFDVPIPPMSEQRRIVAKLDALTARLDRARAELDRVPVLKDRQMLSILRAGVTGALTHDWQAQTAPEPVADLLARVGAPKQGRGGREATDKIIPGMAGLAVGHPGTPLPAGWEWVPLLRLAKQETGHTPSRSRADYWDGGVPWIRDAGAHHGREINETMQTISEAGLANSSARLLPAGTVCLSRTASVGYVTMMARPMATSQDFATWTCTEALVPEYLMYALMAEGDDIRNFGMGSTHTTIYFPEVRAFHIALPPIDEQREIVARIRAALAHADRLEAEAARARALTDRLETAILAKAFRGELVPQDPNDEPASVLLERIRAQRATTSKPKRGQRAKATA